MKIKKSSLWFYSILCCLLIYSSLENLVQAFPQFGLVKRPLLIFVIILLALKTRVLMSYIRRKEYIGVFFLIFIFSISIILSATNNAHRYNDYSPFYAAINLILFIISSYLLVIYAAENNKVHDMMDFIFHYFFLLVIIVDLLIILNIKLEANNAYYLIGTKFSVVYLHLYCLTYFLARKKNTVKYIKDKKVLILFLLFLMSLVAVKVDCNTGIIGCILLIGLIFLFNRFKKYFYRCVTCGSVFLIIILGVTLLSFNFEQIVQYAPIKSFIENVLHRQTTLTGRTDIYKNFILKMTGNWQYGFGYGAAYKTSMLLFRYADTQNALLEWILQLGIYAVTVLVSLYVNIFSGIKKMNNNAQIIPLVAIIYVLVFLGSVEITMDMNFIFCIFLLYAYIHNKDVTFEMDKLQKDMNTRRIKYDKR